MAKKADRAFPIYLLQKKLKEEGREHSLYYIATQYGIHINYLSRVKCNYNGFLTWDMADELAVLFKHHPSDIWDNWWDAALAEETPEERKERLRESERLRAQRRREARPNYKSRKTLSMHPEAIRYRERVAAGYQRSKSA